MQYLKLRRSQILLASFALFALFVTVFPGIDIAISKLFFDGKTFLRDQWWQTMLQQGLKYFLWVSLILVTAIYACNRFLGMKILGVDGRKVLFLYLVLIIGGGLIVNFTFKEHFGRARPRDVAEFGGSKLFSPAFEISHQCHTNCSFSSGDAAGGFFSIALAMALTRRRAAFMAGILVGVVQSFARVSAGAHFFSDTVTSFFVMWIVADVLFYYLITVRTGFVEAKIATEPVATVVPARTI